MTGQPETKKPATKKPATKKEAAKKEAAAPADNISSSELRRARRKARRLGLNPKNGHEAIAMLKERGMGAQDPSKPLTLTDKAKTDGKPDLIPAAETAKNLPATRPKNALPPKVIEKEKRQAEIKELEKKIKKRRDQKIRRMLIRLSVFVIIPTIITALYYYRYATPLFASHSEMNIEQASIASTASQSLLGGTAFGGNEDFVGIQGYLNSRSAYQQLETDFPFSELYMSEDMDRFRRIEPDASPEEKYKSYRKHVKITFDNTDRVLRMEIKTPDQASSVEIAKLLIGYAETRVDEMTQRVRDTGVKDAKILVKNAEEALLEAENYVLSLQEQQDTLSPTADKEFRIAVVQELNAAKIQAELALQELLENSRPNKTRVNALEKQINLLEIQIKQTIAEANKIDEDGLSTTRLDQEMKFAESELLLRTSSYELATQNLHMAEAEARSQRKFLVTSLQPTASFEPVYPKKFMSTLSAFLIFFALYIFIAMTIEVLREQVSA